MTRKRWARNRDSAPDPRKFGHTMHRGPQKLTRREARTLDTLSEDWDMAEGLDPSYHILPERIVITDYTDVWTYMIERMPDDIRYHITVAKRAIARGAYTGWIGPSRFRNIRGRLASLKSEREFLEKVVPLMASHLELGEEVVDRIGTHITELIDEGEELWCGLLDQALRVRAKKAKAQARQKKQTDQALQERKREERQVSVGAV